MSQVITRFAPSPTGHLHIGGVRTALFCWAYARGRNGSFLLRIEDTDVARSSHAAAQGLLQDLAWLGILWDEGPELNTPGGVSMGGDPRGVGPFHQAKRQGAGVYDGYIDQLVEQDLAYPAFDTPQELAAMREAAQGRKETFKYRRGADYDRDGALARMKAGEAHVIRFRAGDEAITVRDEVLGDVKFDAGELDDLVIRKADGFPTYHFAVVVDDELMGVTHVMRGQEHLMNTPRHVALQRALGFRTPVYGHLSIIFNPDGSKMSKRDKDKAVRGACKKGGIGLRPQATGHSGEGEGSALAGVSEGEFKKWLKDKTRQLPSDALVELAELLEVELPEIDVEDFRRSGYLPEAICNYISLLGWNPGMKNEDGSDVEKFDMTFLAEHFDFDRVGKSNSKFDRDKLLSFNQAAIAAMDDELFERRWEDWLIAYRPDVREALGDRLEMAAGAVKPRARTLKDAMDPIGFVFVADDAIEFDEKAVAKVLVKNEGEGLGALADLREVLGACEPFEPEAIEAAIKGYCELKGLGMGKAAQPLRVAATGGMVSPGLGETLGLLGRDATLARIDRCLDRCGE